MTHRPNPGSDLQAALGVARAGRILDRVLASIRSACVPGVTAGQLDLQAQAMLAAADVRPAMLGYTDPWADQPFPAAIAIAVNDQITGSGDPGQRLAPSDLVTIDLVCEHQGWHADAAVSFVIPGQSADPDLANRRRALARAATAVTWAGVEALRPNKPWSEAVTAMAEAADRLGVVLLRGFDGHGIGRSMHAPPRLPSHPLDQHRGRVGPEIDPILSGLPREAGPAQVIRRGMILSVEPVVGWQDLGFVRNGWGDRTANGSDACYAELTVVVGERRNLVLCGAS